MERMDRKVIILTCLLSAGLLLFVTNNLIVPLTRVNARLKNETREKSSRLKDIGDLFATDEQLKELVAELRQRSETMERAVPDEISISLFNDILTRPVNDYGITMTSLSFGAPEKKQLGPSAGTSYATLTATAGMRASFESCVKYVAWLYNQEMHMTVDSLSMEPSSAQEGMLDAKLTVRAWGHAQSLPGIEIEEERALLNRATIEEALRVSVRPEADLSGFKESSFFAEGIRETRLQVPFDGKLILQGIVIRQPPVRSCALINDMLVKEKDTVAGYTVLRIGADGVTLEKNGKSFQLDSKDRRNDESTR